MYASCDLARGKSECVDALVIPPLTLFLTCSPTTAGFISQLASLPYLLDLSSVLLVSCTRASRSSCSSPHFPPYNCRQHIPIYPPRAWISRGCVDHISFSPMGVSSSVIYRRFSITFNFCACACVHFRKEECSIENGSWASASASCIIGCYWYIHIP